MRSWSGRRRGRWLGLSVVGGLALVLAVAVPVSALTDADWSSYLNGPQHPSQGGSASITPQNAGSLVKVWRWKPPGLTGAQGAPPSQFWSSPTVYGGRVYIGSYTGIFYAVNLATGKVAWQRNFGFVPALTCPHPKGFSSTAAVAPDPTSGSATVYISAPDGYLYALDGATGSERWHQTVALPSATQNTYYAWSSPTLANGHIYVGMSSECDKPFARGGLKEFDQATGQLLATYWSMPDGSLGAGIWTSAAVSPTSGNVYVTTGSTTKPPYPQGDSWSMVQLDGDTLAKIGIWTVPSTQRKGDADFGASPTIFAGTIVGTQEELVGASDKNGIFYAFNASNVAAGPVWQTRVANSGFNLAAAVWDGSKLYVASSATTIAGQQFAGSIRELDPSTGQVLWETGLPAAVVGTPSVDGAGVLAVQTWDSQSTQNGTYLINGADGSRLGSVPATSTNAKEFAQPVFVGDEVLVARVTQGLTAYRPS